MFSNESTPLLTMKMHPTRGRHMHDMLENSRKTKPYASLTLPLLSYLQTNFSRIVFLSNSDGPNQQDINGMQKQFKYDKLCPWVFQEPKFPQHRSFFLTMPMNQTNEAYVNCKAKGSEFTTSPIFSKASNPLLTTKRDSTKGRETHPWTIQKNSKHICFA